MGQFDPFSASASDLIKAAADRSAAGNAMGEVIKELKKVNQNLREANEKKAERKN